MNIYVAGFGLHLLKVVTLHNHLLLQLLKQK